MELPFVVETVVVVIKTTTLHPVRVYSQSVPHVSVVDADVATVVDGQVLLIVVTKTAEERSTLCLHTTIRSIAVMMSCALQGLGLLSCPGGIESSSGSSQSSSSGVVVSLGGAVVPLGLGGGVPPGGSGVELFGGSELLGTGLVGLGATGGFGFGFFGFPGLGNGLTPFGGGPVLGGWNLQMSGGQGSHPSMPKHQPPHPKKPQVGKPPISQPQNKHGAGNNPKSSIYML